MKTSVNRRRFTQFATAALAAPAILKTGAVRAQATPIKVGLVTPKTGPLAFFSAPDDFALAQFADALSEGVNGRPIEIIVKDSQSNPNRASDVASELILEDEVSLLLSAGGPANVNPVADQAELNGVPSLSAACPWQPFVMGRGSNPKDGFEMTYLFAFGLEDAIKAYLSLWEGQETNGNVGVIFANDADGNAWGDAQFGFPPNLMKAGYNVTDPGRHNPMLDDFSSYIGAFKAAPTDIVMGTMIPPDFITFWSQSQQQDLRPKIATIGKSLLLPAVPASMGPVSDKLSTEMAWHPALPFKSGITGQSCREIADAWEAETGGPWIQVIGLKHALIDLCVDVLRRTDDATDPDSVLAAIASTDADTALGKANWSNSPIANVAKHTIFGGQWHYAESGPQLEIAANVGVEGVEVTRPLELMGA